MSEAVRPVICRWCRADITPYEGVLDLTVVHCTRCGCTFAVGSL